MPVDKQRFSTAWLTFLGLALFTFSAKAEPLAEDLKAAYIARFIEFIEWPTSTLHNASAFTICVFGEHPVLVPLAKLPGFIRVDDRTIHVNRIVSVRDAATCDIIFVPAASNNELTRLHEYTANKAILVINEIPGGPYSGQQISLYAEGNRLRFNIRLRAAQNSGLKISSRLLKLATIVDSP